MENQLLESLFRWIHVIAGITWIGGWIGSRRPASRVRRLMTVGLVAVLISADAIWYIPTRVGGMRGLYHITRGPGVWIAQQNLGHALILVHAERWFQYAQLLPLVPPFTESDLRVAWSRNPEADAALVESVPDRAVYTYNPITGTLSPYAP